MPRQLYGVPEPLLIEAQGAATAKNSKVHTSGDILLDHDTLGYGGVIAAMDVWLSISGNADKKFPKLRQGQSYLGGWGSPFCSIISAVWDDSNLQPTGIARDRWDNSKGAEPEDYSIVLSKSESETDSAEWDTKLTITDTMTVGLEASLPGVGKASASNSISVGLEVGHSWSTSRTITVGSSDTTGTTLQPGEAELVLLSALKGSLALIVTMQTRWEGTFEYQFENGKWQTMDLETLQVQGLARPFDKGGIHNGIITLKLNFGTITEQDISTIKVTDTSETGWRTAELDILKSRFG